MNAEFHEIKKLNIGCYMRLSEKIFVLTVIFIMLSTLSASAVAEPSLLWKRTFDSRIIKTSTLEDFDATKGKGAPFPLKTVMTEKSICVLNDIGEITRKITLEDYAKSAMSDDGSTKATLTGREITISNLDEEVQGIVRIADPQPVVLPEHVTFELSPDGKYIVVMSNFTHTIYFHDRKGKMLSRHNVEDLRGAEIRFSKDSRYVAIHVPNWGEGNTNGYLLYFDQKVKNLWRFDHKGCQAGFDVSSDGSAVVLAAEDRLYSLNAKGTVIYEKELVPGNITLAVSENGQYVAIVRQNDHRVSFFDNQKGELQWSHIIEGFDPLNSPFTSLDVSDSGDCVAVAVSKNWTRRNKESFLYAFNTTGDIIWENSFDKSSVEVVMCALENCVLIIGDREVALHRF